MAPLLVGKKQASKQAKQEEVIRAVKFFLRYVKCYAGEIPISALPAILKDFDLALRRHPKQQSFFALLRQWNWVYVKAEYSHPARHGARCRQGTGLWHRDGNGGQIPGLCSG